MVALQAKNVQNRMPRRSKILSQSLQPLGRNYINILSKRSEPADQQTVDNLNDCDLDLLRNSPLESQADSDPVSTANVSKTLRDTETNQRNAMLV